MEEKKITKAMRWRIAEYLANDRLPSINAKLEPVKVRSGFYSKYIKRLIDIIVSGVVLILLLPINLIVGVITFFDVGSPIFFKQQRTGKDGKLFGIVKFRNMRNTTDENGHLLPPAQRVTKFGKFVRKTSIDELLNFWSILKGDMSLIGPRPLVPEYHHRYNSRHVMRLAVRPGLECPPRFKSDKVWTWQDQFDNDVWYVENISFITDCKMILNLIRFTFDRKSANARAMTSRGIFMGYSEDGVAINMSQVPEEYVNRVLSEMDVMDEAVLVERKD